MKIQDAPHFDRLPTRFWSKVERAGEGECWSWAGSRNPSGHGQFGVGRTVFLAHRVAYLLERGDIPEGAIVTHSCDEVACVNPRHLTVTSQSELIPTAEPDEAQSQDRAASRHISSPPDRGAGARDPITVP